MVFVYELFVVFTTKWNIYIINKLQIINRYFMNLFKNLYNLTLNLYKYIFICVYI